MNASYEWLRSLVPAALSPRELADLFTARCAAVEEMVPLRSDLASIVVGRVVEAARHPDSDHLWVTRVDAGGGTLLDVVCGAPNVQAGKLYPFAASGTVLPGGLKLEKRKIRGAVSNGMLCSARELGLGQEHDGILELSVDVAPGTPLLSAMPLGDTRFVIDVLPNRPDLLSHLGLAREISAATGTPIVDPTTSTPPVRWTQAPASALAGAITVRVEDTEGVLRLAGVVIRGVKIGPSPDWLVARLAGVGSRSINNVVDVTNCMLHELGQPMHAFDLARMAGGAVVPRRARAGETITTLDGVKRVLTADMTVIADGERAQAIAGIMGGADSEVLAETRDIFLEVACFNPRRIRATRQRLGLSTDASHRFERGVDPDLQPRALARAVALIVETAGGTIDGSAVDITTRPSARGVIALRPARVGRVLGVDVPPDEITTLLRGVGFEIAAGTAAGSAGSGADATLNVRVPSWRLDVAGEVDLIEEVARLRGFDSFPSALGAYRLGRVPDAPHLAAEARVRDTLLGLGLCEARPMPFVRGDTATHVRVTNPLAEDEAFLRRDVLESLARAAEHNLSRMHGDVRLFEIGAVFAPVGAVLPREEIRIGALIMGARRPVHFSEPKPPAFDEWDAKALAERALAAAFPGEVTTLGPGSSDSLWTLHRGGEVIGHVRRVVLDAPVWASPAFGVEMVLTAVASEPPAAAGQGASGRGVVLDVPRARPSRYRPLPVTPAVELDLALLTPDTVAAGAVGDVIRRGAGDLLEALVLFDEFRGTGVPAGSRSLAWRLTFRHPTRTLREKEIEGRRDTLLRILDKELGVRQRSG